MYRKLLVANDGSSGGENALVSALELARLLGVGLDMVCVEELPSFPASIDEVTEAQSDAGAVFAKVLRAAKAKAKAAGVPFEAHIVSGHPVTTIVEFVKAHGYDVLVVGFMGHSALYNRLIGSTSDRLVRHAPCKVLVVK